MSKATAVAVAPRSFDFVQQMIAKEAGIVLEAGKEYLVEARLGPVARRAGFPSIDSMLDVMRAEPGSVLKREVLDAMTTNETSFYRDIEPFVVLEKHVLPKLLAARRAQRQLRIWYAASSTGQEPYSVSMLLHEKFPEVLSWRFDQLATDISSQALARARAGVFTQLEVNRGLPARLLPRYFTKKGPEWHLADDIRQMVRFEPLNLNAPWPTAMREFDIVFIRNVMIYFDVAAKKRILDNIYRRLAPDGYLFLGAAETTFNLDERFTRSNFDRSGCYTRADEAALAAAKA